MQGSYDIYPKGLVLIEHGLGSQDSSGAIERRLRLFTADKVIDVKDTKPLLYYHQGKWKGLLRITWYLQLDIQIEREPYLIWKRP